MYKNIFLYHTMSDPEREIEEISECGTDDYDDMGMEVDVPALMTSLLSSEDGDNVCTAILKVSQQVEVQNKILIKILSQLTKKDP